MKFFNQNGGAIKLGLPDSEDKYDAVFMYYESDFLWEYMDPDVAEQEVYGYEWSEDAPESAHPPTGWYLLNEDTGVLYCMNDYKVPYGAGVVLDYQSEGKDAYAVFKGCVEAKDAKVNLSKGFNYTGNCTPKKWGMSDIAVGGGFDLASRMKFFNQNGGAIKVGIPDSEDKYDAVFMYYESDFLWEYMDPDVAEQEVYGYEWAEDAPESAHPPTGWYLLNEDTGVLYCMNDYTELNPGDGFTIDYQSEGAGFIVVPSALGK